MTQTTPPGAQYSFSAKGESVNVVITANGNNLPQGIPGEFNLELVTAPDGTSFNVAFSQGYQSAVLLPGGTGQTAQLLAGNFGITDTGTGDVITLLSNGAQTVVGGKGDTINGGSGNDTINGIAGPELINVGSGATTVYGGVGDTIVGANGTVYIDGSLGSQLISGGGGESTIFGGAGDTITGTAGTGASTIFGAQHDTITGGFGADLIDALTGSQSITGGGGSTTVWGGHGDTIAAGSGNAYIDGSLGGMAVAAGSGGNDIIIGSIASTAGGPVDTLTGGGALVQIQGLGKGDVLNFTAQSGNATINATAGNIAAALGSGVATVYGGVGDTIAAGSGNAYIDGSLGGMAVAAGSGGNDIVIGAIASTAGAGVDTLTGGAATVQIQGLGKGDIVNFAAQTGSAAINATAGNVALTLGGGGATVYAGAGDTINLGSVGQYVDARGGGLSIKLGAGGNDSIIGSTVTGAGDTITGGAAALNYNPGVGGDLINLAGFGGAATINAVGADTGPINDTVIASNGGDSVFGGWGDRIGVGSSASGGDFFNHASTISGASIGFGSNDTVVAATYGTTAGAVTVNSFLAGSSSAAVSINGFSEAGGTPTDSIFYPGESSSTNASIVATATQVIIGGAASTQFTLPDGTMMTLLGVPQADFNTAFFKP